MTQSERWADLRVRLTSAAVLIAVGAAEVYLGGGPFLVGVVLLIAAMIWELAGMAQVAGATPRVMLGAGAGLCLYLSTLHLPSLAGFGLLVLPPVALFFAARRDREVLAPYALAVIVAGAGFVSLRATGAGLFLWLVVVVVITDTMGYFVGRLIGGPKFWPQVSPKKTWSGTIAGWVGAAVAGAGFGLAHVVPWGLVLASPLVALAGQTGDIAESWIKRRAGLKDTSGLIPGHGGVLDRFDALIGAMLAVQAMTLVIPGLV